MNLNKKKKVNVIFFSVVFLIGILLTGCSNNTAATTSKSEVPQKVYKWRMVTHQTPGTTRYDATIIPFVNAIKEASGGRLIIEPYGAGTLFPVSDSLDQVKNGVVQMAAIWSGYWGGKDPVFNLLGGIPGDPVKGFEEHGYRTEQLDPIISKTYEKYGIKYLGMFDYAGRDILMSNKPIRSVDDFKGVNIRTSGIGAEFYKKLGASGVSVPGPEVYTALQLGTVDAAEYNDWIVNKEMGFDEVTKYVIEPSMHNGALSDKDLIVNPKAWEELPDDLKAIVLTARDTARYLSTQKFGAASEIVKSEWVEKGVEIINLPDEDVQKMREISLDFLNEYKEKNPGVAEFLNKYAEVLYNLGYIEEAKKLGYQK